MFKQQHKYSKNSFWIVTVIVEISRCCYGVERWLVMPYWPFRFIQETREACHVLTVSTLIEYDWDIMLQHSSCWYLRRLDFATCYWVMVVVYFPFQNSVFSFHSSSHQYNYRQCYNKWWYNTVHDGRKGVDRRWYFDGDSISGGRSRKCGASLLSWMTVRCVVNGRRLCSPEFWRMLMAAFCCWIRIKAEGGYVLYVNGGCWSFEWRCILASEIMRKVSDDVGRL